MGVVVTVEYGGPQSNCEDQVDHFVRTLRKFLDSPNLPVFILSWGRYPRSSIVGTRQRHYPNPRCSNGGGKVNDEDYLAPVDLGALLFQLCNFSAECGKQMFLVEGPLNTSPNLLEQLRVSSSTRRHKSKSKSKFKSKSIVSNVTRVNSDEFRTWYARWCAAYDNEDESTKMEKESSVYEWVRNHCLGPHTKRRRETRENRELVLHKAIHLSDIKFNV